jgi:diadenosine tetraphosphate (Ap4A) HIT family hydrolase
MSVTPGDLGAHDTHRVDPACPLCTADGGQLVWRDTALRVILADEAAYPGFCRVVWNAHVAELSDLDEGERAHLFNVLLVVERVVRRVMACDKINLASLGNMVPHLHWHVIPRFADDAHFPNAVWSAPAREVDASLLQARQQRAAVLEQALVQALTTLSA